MAINSCSINAHTINGLACRRHVVIPVPAQAAKSHPYHTRLDFSEREHDEEINVANLEGANILVSLEFNGEKFEQTLSNSFADFVPMIIVNNLTIDINEPEISISNLIIKMDPRK
jgi:hypothetical protein